MENENKKTVVSLMAIDRYVTTNIVSSKEEEIKGKDFIVWGGNNRYPQYIWNLSQDVTLLRTIINGIADYVVGNNVSIAYTPWQEQVNGKGDTIEDMTRLLASDYARYGGFAINVIRNRQGGIAEVHYVDFKLLRSSKEGDFFYYSENWDKSYGRVDYTAYPKFRPDGKEYSSIYYYKNNRSTVYPLPPIAGDATVAAETEKAIQEFHLNSIKNGLSASVIINFNNGQPSDEEKEEIEKNLNEKFAGETNAARMMVAFNNAKDNEVTISKLDIDNFADRYQALAKATKQEIYSAFRAQPILFGLPAENLGFSSQDIGEAWKLFNGTVILPIQKIIKAAFEKILGEKDVIAIEPIAIDWNTEKKETVISVK